MGRHQVLFKNTFRSVKNGDRIFSGLVCFLNFCLFLISVAAWCFLSRLLQEGVPEPLQGWGQGHIWLPTVLWYTGPDLQWETQRMGWQ